MKPEHPFNLNSRHALMIVGVITLAGNALLAAKILNLWPSVISIFFASLKIYFALHSILNQLIS